MVLIREGFKKVFKESVLTLFLLKKIRLLGVGGWGGGAKYPRRNKNKTLSMTIVGHTRMRMINQVQTNKQLNKDLMQAVDDEYSDGDDEL